MIMFIKIIIKTYTHQNKQYKLKLTKIKILITITILFSKIKTLLRKLKYNKLVSKHNILLKQK